MSALSMQDAGVGSVEEVAKAIAGDFETARAAAPETVHAIAERVVTMRSALHDLNKQRNRYRTKLRRAVNQRASLDQALGDFLAKTDAIRAAAGEEDRYFAREAQHEAFKALRNAFQTIEKETDQ